MKSQGSRVEGNTVKLFFKSPFRAAYFWRGLSTEGNLRFTIDWASLIVGSLNLPFSLCFNLYLRAIFQVQAPGVLMF